MKLLPCNTEINAFTTLVVVESTFEDKATTRPAAVVGGYTSRSGLTKTPQWVEEGAVVAVREDSINPDTMADEAIVFPQSEHGALLPRAALQIVRKDELGKAIDAWEGWRKDIGLPKPTGKTYVNYLARRVTRSYYSGSLLTAGEAMALARFEGATLEIKHDIEDNDSCWVVEADGKTAIGWGDNTTPPEHFEAHLVGEEKEYTRLDGLLVRQVWGRDPHAFSGWGWVEQPRVTLDDDFVEVEE